MVTEKVQPGTPRSGNKESSEPGSRPRPRTLRPRRDWLAQGLREIYEESLSDPIPDSFKLLLDELERKEQTEADQTAAKPPDQPDCGGQ